MLNSIETLGQIPHAASHQSNHPVIQSSDEEQNNDVIPEIIQDQEEVKELVRQIRPGLIIGSPLSGMRTRPKSCALGMVEVRSVRSHALPLNSAMMVSFATHVGSQGCAEVQPAEPVCSGLVRHAPSHQGGVRRAGPQQGGHLRVRVCKHCKQYYYYACETYYACTWC